MDHGGAGGNSWHRLNFDLRLAHTPYPYPLEKVMGYTPYPHTECVGDMVQ